MYNITATVEKEDENGKLRIDAVRLTEIGGGIAHTVTCREPAFCVNHCNLVVQFKEIKTLKYTDVKQIKIRQATEQGFALCEIGGGSGLGLSNKPNTARKSNRERKDLPDIDNGEYP